MLTEYRPKTPNMGWIDIKNTFKSVKISGDEINIANSYTYFPLLKPALYLYNF
jgi:hypothetical protein